mmetsp:Transcript_95627/g.270604  ORF Transcript_95627/g.270604 Transcript_95627/m.270604 type:complete len:153 (+) Transcript_95627:578-1036(+)
MECFTRLPMSRAVRSVDHEYDAVGPASQQLLPEARADALAPRISAARVHEAKVAPVQGDVVMQDVVLGPGLKSGPTAPTSGKEMAEGRLARVVEAEHEHPRAPSPPGKATAQGGHGADEKATYCARGVAARWLKAHDLARLCLLCSSPGGSR